MPRKDNQKKKLLALREIFLSLTDENHPLTMAQIIQELGRYDIAAERRSLYDDFALLEEFGLEVMHVRQGSTTAYYAAGREYDLVELKFMIDCIQASRSLRKGKPKSSSKRCGGCAANTRPTSFAVKTCLSIASDTSMKRCITA